MPKDKENKKEVRSYTHREPGEFNRFRAFFQWLTCSVVYGSYYKIACGLKIYSIPFLYKDTENPVSYTDPGVPDIYRT